MNVLIEVFSTKLSKGHLVVKFPVSSLMNSFAIDAYEENSYNGRTLLALNKLQLFLEKREREREREFLL
jgi:hypothetical protein